MENEPDGLCSGECVQNRMMLWKAVEEGRENDVRSLLPETECDINGKDHRGCTLLSTAVALGLTTIVNLLFKKDGIDLNVKDDEGYTPLNEAASRGYEDIVSLLLVKEDVELNPRDMLDRTPLSAAAANGHEAIVSLLLKRDDIELNPRDIHGETPLSLALARGHEAVAALLLNQDDIDLGPDYSMERGYALLSTALEQGFQRMASSILQAKINHNPEIPTGRSPLSWAAEKNRMYQTKLLLNISTLNPNQHDSGGRTPLSRAAENNSISAVNLLLENSGVNVDCKDQDGSTPLLRAVVKQHNIVVFSLAARDTVTLHSLVQEGNLSPIEYLLDNGYAINTKDSQGQTPLHIAILNHHFEIADKLLSRGADVNVEDKHSTNPLSLAVQLQLRDFAELLLENFACMRGIKFKSWRKLYQEFHPQFCLHILERATGVRKVNFFSMNDTPPSETEIGRQLFLSSTYQAWSLTMLTFPEAVTASFANLPDSEDTNRIISYHQYNGQHSRAYTIAPVPTLQAGSGKSQITWEGFGVAWTWVDLREDDEPTQMTEGYQYFSMLQDGWIPEDGIEMFQ
ncbi:hypothetical protein FSARC_14044 [Fusarium sarcochroum]|uniref:Ankyrin n=1 Tax=Fusarium sarcochroum TaxID=1208366 RepID=A0A8H4SWP0_9HYPO|nr:hypothetical protein FSARC_14044 [Fusarium sarcochroum]